MVNTTWMTYPHEQITIECDAVQTGPRYNILKQLHSYGSHAPPRKLCSSYGIENYNHERGSKSWWKNILEVLRGSYLRLLIYMLCEDLAPNELFLYCLRTKRHDTNKRMSFLLLISLYFIITR